MSEFGEKVLFEPIVKYSAADKLEASLHYRMFSGMTLKANEVILGKVDDGDCQGFFVPSAVEGERLGADSFLRVCDGPA